MNPKFGRIRRLLANPAGRIGLLILGLAIVVALAGPELAPKDPLQQSLAARLRPPVGFEGYREGFFFGTDQFGRDVLSRLIHGTRVSLAFAFISSFV